MIHLNRSRYFLTGLVLLLVLPASVLPQTRTRITFIRGAVSTEVSGMLTGFESKKSYVLRLRKGQTFQTEQIGDGSRPITISIKDPNGKDVGDADASCNNRKEITPTVAGEYTIDVVECQKADPWRGRFTFRVTVR